MADNTQRPIVIKRIKKQGGGAHGGAWKIAYADFVTAMMAFFLLMWLLGSVTKGELQGIADYFRTPLKVALSGGSGAGDVFSATAVSRHTTRMPLNGMRAMSAPSTSVPLSWVFSGPRSGLSSSAGRCCRE